MATKVYQVVRLLPPNGAQTQVVFETTRKAEANTKRRWFMSHTSLLYKVVVRERSAIVKLKDFEYDEFVGEYSYTRPDGYMMVVGRPPTDAPWYGWDFHIIDTTERNCVYREGWLASDDPWTNGRKINAREAKALALSAINSDLITA